MELMILFVNKLFNLACPVAELRICWQYLWQRGKALLPKAVSWVGHLTASDHKTGDLESVEYPSFPLLPGPLWPGVVISVRIPTISWIDLREKKMYSIRIQISLNIFYQ